MDEAKIITNNFQGNTTVLQSVENIDSALPEWFRPYEKELKIWKKKIDLRQATEALINQKKVFRSLDVDRVKGYLNGNNVCLVKASEGRGKTFLSRIVAYDFHRENKEVYFVDFCDVEEEYNGSEKDPINRIENVLNNWESNTETKYLLVLENVHACPKLEDLIEVVGDRRCADTETEKGNVQILLNSRPTDEGVNYFEEWNEVVVLHPDEDAVREVINIYSNEEKDRNPFENDDSDEAFVSSICSNNNQNGTNLRWLGYYLWTWMSDSTINHVSDVDEDKIIEKVKKNYKLDRINIDDLQGLLYFSSIFQFGVSLHRDIISCLKGLTDGSGKNRLDRFVRKPYNILSRKQGRYSMAHSFDAYILNKAICDYIGVEGCIKKTKEIVEEYVNAILRSGNPSDYESDFKLLISGLSAKKEEFKEVIYCLTNLGMAEKIMKNINPGFVFCFFILDNHEYPNRDALIKYYHNNLNYLRSIILKMAPGGLDIVLKVFEKNLCLNIVSDIFATPQELYDYLSNNYNYRILIYDNLVSSIAKLGPQFASVLKDFYHKNIGALKPIFLGLSATRLHFLYRIYKKNMDINIVEDAFEDPVDLEEYLSVNNRVLSFEKLLHASADFDDEFKLIIKHQYENNKDLLKQDFFKRNPIQLHFLYRFYKKKLDINIVESVFEDPVDLEEYLSANKKALIDPHLLRTIADLGDGFKLILEKQYENNKESLKQDFCKVSPTLFTFLYKFYKNSLGIDIVSDIFCAVRDVEDYMENNVVEEFQYDDVLVSIRKLGESHKQVLDKYGAFDHFFYTNSSSKERYCICPEGIYTLSNPKLKKHIDYKRIKKNGFYLDGVSWGHMATFIYVIGRDMNNENHQLSIEMVNELIKIVLDKEKSLSYATSSDLSYFYYNITAVDKDIANNLMRRECVIADIKRRLESTTYSVDDLNLFGFFYQQPWCKEKLESRILNADSEQQKIINEWREGLVRRLEKRGEGKTSGTLLAFIINMNTPVE